MEYYDYGKVILSKGTILYHWSNTKLIIDDLYNNLFLCLDNSFWSDKNKIMHKFKLKKDIELILTIKNDDIINKNNYLHKNKRYDYELLTTIYNNIFDKAIYNRNDDVKLKQKNPDFISMCNKLDEKNYTGLFNYLDCDKGQFEIVIFQPSEYLALIDCITDYNAIKFHTLRDCKRIMLSKKINFVYPHIYYHELTPKRYNHYPSIFYYIYKKLIQKKYF
jgi:hypothetical protein